MGLVHQQQDLFFGGRRYASEFKAGPDWLKLAEAFGWSAVSLGAAEAPQKALAEAMKRPGPVLIHAPIARDAKVYPMVPPGGANKEMILR